MAFLLTLLAIIAALAAGGAAGGMAGTAGGAYLPRSGCGHPAGAGRLGLCGMACGAARADGRIRADVCLRAGDVSAELSSEHISAVFRRTGGVRGSSGRVSPGVRREVRRS